MASVAACCAARGESRRRLSFAAIALFWCVFCGALAIRGPSAFTEALALPAPEISRASAMLVLRILLAGAVGTQGIAPFIAGVWGTPLALGILGLCALSLLLVVPNPRPGLAPT